MDKKQLLIGLRKILTMDRLVFKTDTGYTYTYFRDIPRANEYLENLISTGDYIDYSYREDYPHGNVSYVSVYLIRREEETTFFIL
jgi:hypothetical protein